MSEKHEDALEYLQDQLKFEHEYEITHRKDDLWPYRYDRGLHKLMDALEKELYGPPYSPRMQAALDKAFQSVLAFLEKQRSKNEV